MRVIRPIIFALAAIVFASDAPAQTQRGPTRCICGPWDHRILPAGSTCEQVCSGSTGSPSRAPSSAPSPTIDHEAERRAREAEAQAERDRQAAEDRQRKEEAERQARFIRDRDAAAGTLRGSIGTSAGANSTGGTQLRGSSSEVVGRQLRGTVSQPDVGGPQAAWKQLHCAASILSPALAKLKIDGTPGDPDYAEFRFLADEAANALNGQRLRVTCAPAPAMPQSTRPATDPAQQAQAQAQVVTKVRELATKLEDGRRKQEQAQATMRQANAPVSAADGAVASVVEEQRRINRARDQAGNEMARAQRDLNEGKRTTESATRELKKIQESVERVVTGERVVFE